jgi:HK97 gp10 family phage protein
MSDGITTTLQWNGERAIREFDVVSLESLTAGSILIRGKAVLLAPVDQGNLRNSITYVVSGSSEDFPDVAAGQSGGRVLFGGRTLSAKEGEAIIGTVVFYAPYVEFGTRYQRAQPFLLPAFNSSIQTILGFFRRNYRGVRFVQ